MDIIWVAATRHPAGNRINLVAGGSKAEYPLHQWTRRTQLNIGTRRPLQNRSIRSPTAKTKKDDLMPPATGFGNHIDCMNPAYLAFQTMQEKHQN